MRITQSFLFLLISAASAPAGISSSNVVLNNNGSGQEELELFPSLLQISYIQDSVDEATLKEKIRAADKLMKETCEKNSGSNAYKVAKNGWEDFLSCEKKTSHDITSDFKTKDDNLLNNIHKSCGMATGKEKDCFKKFQQSIEPCLEKDEREVVETVYNIAMSSLTFLCEDDAARIKKLSSDDGMTCMNSKTDSLVNCLVKFTDLYNNSEAKSSIKRSHIYMFLSEFKQCGNIDQFQHCAIKALKECKNQMPAEIMEGLFKSIKSNSDCQKSGEASVSKVIDGILITILLGIVTHFG